MLKDKFRSLMDKLQSNDDIESDYFEDDYGYQSNNEDYSYDTYNNNNLKFEEEKSKKSSNLFTDVDNSRDFKINNASTNTTNTILHVLKPRHVDDWRLVGDNLKKNNIVLINFEGVPSDVPQRVTDCIFGLCYALDAVARYVNQNILIVVPKNVELTGDVQKNINKKIYEVSSDNDSYHSFSQVDNLDNLYNN